MPGYAIRNLPVLTAATTGAGAVTNAIGSLDDADAITIFLISTAAAASSGAGLSLQVSQFDPAIDLPLGVTQSTGFNSLSSTIFSSGAGLLTSSGYAITIEPVAFRGLRIGGLTSATSGENIARVVKRVIL